MTQLGQHLNPADLATLEDLDAILSLPPAHPWVTALVQQGTTPLNESAVLDVAAEFDGSGQCGPTRLHAVNGLLDALALRTSGDATAQAMLAALRHLHIPMLLDEARGL